MEVNSKCCEAAKLSLQTHLKCHEKLCGQHMDKRLDYGIGFYFVQHSRLSSSSSSTRTLRFTQVPRHPLSTFPHQDVAGDISGSGHKAEVLGDASGSALATEDSEVDMATWAPEQDTLGRHGGNVGVDGGDMSMGDMGDQGDLSDLDKLFGTWFGVNRPMTDIANAGFGYEGGGAVL